MVGDFKQFCERVHPTRPVCHYFRQARANVTPNLNMLILIGRIYIYNQQDQHVKQ